MERTKQVGFVVALWAIIAALCPPAGAQFGGGTGEPNDPYLIDTAEQMNAIGADPNCWDKHFRLCADIDLSAYTGDEFNIIGGYSAHVRGEPTSPVLPPFSGVFDGDGYVISNFSYAHEEESYIGLFGYVNDPNAEIKNVGLLNPSVAASTGSYVGSLVGSIRSGSVTNCFVVGANVAGQNYIGGLLGCNGGNIAQCQATGTVSGSEYVGGLVGRNAGRNGSAVRGGDGDPPGPPASGNMSECSATVSVTGVSRVGDPVGSSSYGTLRDCDAASDVTGVDHIGGLAGANAGAIERCSADGAMVGTDWRVGRIQCWTHIELLQYGRGHTRA